MDSITEVNRHAKTVHDMDLNNQVDVFLFAEPQFDIQDDINGGIKQEPNLELDIKQATNLEADMKQEPIPILKPFAFIDANDKDTCKTPTNSSNKSLKILEAYTLVDLEVSAPSYINSEVDKQKQGNELTILKQEPDKNEVRDSTTDEFLVERESETRMFQNPAPLKAKVADAFDRCEYFCRICSEEFYTEFKLSRHIWGVHNEGPHKYRKKFGPLQTKVRFHRCGLCGESVRHSRDDIYKHLKRSQKHESDAMGFSLETYHKRYMGGQWYNQCWFDCRKCPEKFMSKSDLVSHIQQKHGFKKVEKYINTLGPLMTKKNTHKCQVCTQIIKCTETAVLQHLSLHHLSLKDYNEKYLNAITRNIGNSTVKDTKSENGPRRNNKKSPAKDKIFKCHACHKTFAFEYFHDLTTTHKCQVSLFRDKHVSSSAKKGDEAAEGLCEQKIGTEKSSAKCPKTQESVSHRIPPIYKPKMKEALQKCEYFCRLCPEEFYSPGEIFSHIKKAHPRMVRYKGKSFTGQFTYIVKESYGKLMTKEVKHKCHLCRRDVTHNQYAIKRHLNEVHGVDLMTYYKKFLQCRTDGTELKIQLPDPEDVLVTHPLDKCEHFCRMCPEKFWSYANLTQHIKWRHYELSVQQYRDEYGPLLTKPVSHKCKLCGKVIRHSLQAFNDHFNKDHNSKVLCTWYQERYMTQSWYNQCKYDCRVCKNKTGVFKSQPDLENHIRNAHKLLESDKYVATYGPMLTQEIRHKCQVCKQAIICREDDIREHLTLHDLSLDSYSAEFMDMTLRNQDKNFATNDIQLKMEVDEGETVNQETNYSFNTIDMQE